MSGKGDAMALPDILEFGGLLLSAARTSASPSLARLAGLPSGSFPTTPSAGSFARRSASSGWHLIPAGNPHRRRIMKTYIRRTMMFSATTT
ncbi:MAG TPA: hypothetical protein VFF96_09355 [Pseudoxanthomonas sp.]|nr:hypothetical protein [Pseudoxanthomonas sp.]